MGNPKQKWTAEEEEALRAGVSKHGAGKWKNIQRDPEFNKLLFSRSNIDLKDKWRNLSVASGQMPRDKSKAPKPKGPDTPAAPIPVAHTSSSIPIIPSTQDVTTDVVMIDASKSLTDGNTAAKYNAMIFEALATLKEPNGSDCSAIATFIERPGGLSSIGQMENTSETQGDAMEEDATEERSNEEENYLTTLIEIDPETKSRRRSKRVKKRAAATITPRLVPYPPVKKKNIGKNIEDPDHVFKEALSNIKWEKTMSTLELRHCEVIAKGEGRGKYDPCCYYDKHSVEEFMGWSQRTRRKFTGFAVPSYHLPGIYDSQWFDNIHRRRGWLCSSNIDVFMHIVILKAKKWPHMFLNDWVHVDTYFWESVMWNWEGWKNSVKNDREWNWKEQNPHALSHVHGYRPENGRCLPWSSVYHVYGVANPGGQHWVLYDIMPRLRKIVAYDSLCTSIDKWVHKATFNKFTQLMGSMLGGDPLSLELATDTPQANGHNCGIMALKFFECFVSGNPLSRIDPERGGNFRDSICCDLYRIWQLCC